MPTGETTQPTVYVLTINVLSIVLVNNYLDVNEQRMAVIGLFLFYEDVEVERPVIFKRRKKLIVKLKLI